MIFCVYTELQNPEKHGAESTDSLALTDPEMEINIKDKHVTRREKFLPWPIVSAAIENKQNLGDHSTSKYAEVFNVKSFKFMSVQPNK